MVGLLTRAIPPSDERRSQQTFFSEVQAHLDARQFSTVEEFLGILTLIAHYLRWWKFVALYQNANAPLATTYA
jgi:hypothetical protein